MYIIPITPETLDLITVLNDGARPVLEEGKTFYIFQGRNEHAEIVTHREASRILDASPGKPITIHHL